MPFSELENIPDFGVEPLDMTAIGFAVVGSEQLAILLCFNEPDLAGVTLLMEIVEGSYKRGLFVDKRLEGFAVDAVTGDYLCYGPSGYLVFRQQQQYFDDSTALDMGYTFDYGELTRAKRINNQYCLLGMSRQAYLGIPSSWRFIADDVLDTSVEKLNFSGFFDAVELTTGILCVGVGGDAWVYEEKSWRRSESGTNLDLHSGCNYGGSVWVGGQMGVLLNFKEGFWFDHTLEDQAGDISAISAFGEHLVLLINGALFSTRLAQDDVLEPLQAIAHFSTPIITLEVVGDSLFALSRNELWQLDRGFNATPLNLQVCLQGKKITLR